MAQTVNVNFRLNEADKKKWRAYVVNLDSL